MAFLIPFVVVWFICCCIAGIWGFMLGWLPASVLGAIFAEMVS
jgi:hypothetical protein